MQSICVGLITIGQTPRTDLTSDFTRLWGDAFTVVEEGALDGLTDREIAVLAPLPGESDLITVLQDGRTVLVAHERLEPYVQSAIDRAVGRGALLAVVACTGGFDRLQTAVPVVMPSKVLAYSAAMLLEAGKSVAVIVPTVGQANEARTRWRSRGYAVTRVMVASPFDGPDQWIGQIQADRDVYGADALIVDCFGFDAAFGAKAAETFPGPVLIPRVLVARLLTGLYCRGE